ncbi:FecCD family ABC transporter permease [Fontibacillus phaseoli]|nr:iron ABC transporter permease [Fontibacillus phaseoli]
MSRPKSRRVSFTLRLIVASAGLIGMFLIAMVFGAAHTSIHEVWLALTSSQSTDTLTMIREIRLPREVAAALVGAALAVSGSIMQGITRNPLADPGLLGLTSGANAALAITMAFLPAVGYGGVISACFIGAAAGSVIVFGIGAARRGGLSPIKFVLAGAAVSTFLYAVADGVGLYFQKSKDVSMWTAGGLNGTSWLQLKLIVPLILIGIVTALLLSRQLTVLSLSEEVAAGLGQRIHRIKAVLFVVNIVLAGAAVALVGNMVFIGLMVPHIVRAIVGTDYRRIVPMSVIMGAILMLLADTLSRNLNPPFEIPIAAIGAVMGLPFFLMVIKKGGKSFS